MAKPLIYYSGYGGQGSDPEVVLAEKANVMLTFADMKKKPIKRFKEIKKARKAKKG